MKRPLDGLLLGASAASVVGMLVAAGSVGLAFRRSSSVEPAEQARVLAERISGAMTLGLLVSLLLLVPCWWAVRRWRREP